MKPGRAIVTWAALGLAAIAVIAGPAQAEVAFKPPLVVDATEAGTPQIAVDSQGRATVVWTDLGPKGETLFVRAQRLDSSGFPGPIHTLATVPKITQQCVCPHVAVDPTGRATIAWQTVTSEGRRIEATQIGADGVPQPAQILSPPGVEGDWAWPAVNSEGVAVVAWEVRGFDTGIEAVQLDPDGVAGEVHRLSEEDVGTSPAIAVGPEDKFYVAWRGDGIEATTLDAGGAAEEIQTVSPSGEPAGAPEIVVDSQGRATISWWRHGGPYQVRAVRLDSDGTPETVHTLSPLDQAAFDPRLAIDPEGRVTAVWSDFEERVFSVRIDAEGVPAEARQLSAEGSVAAEPQVAAAADGRVVVTWTHPSTPFIPEPGCQELELKADDDVVRAAFIGADGQLNQIANVSPHGQQSFGAELGLDPLGLPWVAWWSFDGTYFCDDWDTRVQASHALTVQPPKEGPPTGSSPIPPVDPAPPQEAILRLARRGLTQNGRVALRARCQGPGGVCAGAVQLVVPIANLRPALTSNRRPRPLLALARGRYRIPAGRAKTLFLPIARAARSFLGKGEKRWILAKVRGTDLNATTVLVRWTGANP